MKHFSEIPLNSKAVIKKTDQVYQCPICKDQGVYFKGDIAYTCRCSKKKMTDARRLKAGISPHLARQTFDSFDLSYYADDKRAKNKLTYRENAEKILNEAKSFVSAMDADASLSGLLFQGGVGSGKTFLAAACANALIDRGYEVKFIVVPDFLDQIRESFQQSSELNESDLMFEAKTVPVLILDDLGAHNYTDWSIKTIFAILNYRVNFELPTIVTTNLERQQLEELLGSRIFSRLMEACRFFRLENVKDIRMEKRIREIRKG